MNEWMNEIFTSRELISGIYFRDILREYTFAEEIIKICIFYGNLFSQYRAFLMVSNSLLS